MDLPDKDCARSSRQSQPSEISSGTAEAGDMSSSCRAILEHRDDRDVPRCPSGCLQ